MVIGDVYEVHGSRAATSLHTTGAGASVLLMLLLANSVCTLCTTDSTYCT